MLREQLARLSKYFSFQCHFMASLDFRYVLHRQAQCNDRVKGMVWPALAYLAPPVQDASLLHSSFPHSDFPDGSREAASNYCRDPHLIDRVVSCYYINATTGATVFEQCDVPDCPPGGAGKNSLGDQEIGNLSRNDILIIIKLYNKRSMNIEAWTARTAIVSHCPKFHPDSFFDHSVLSYMPFLRHGHQM